MPIKFRVRQLAYSQETASKNFLENQASWFGTGETGLGKERKQG